MSGKFNLYLRLKPSAETSPESSFFKVNNQNELQLLVPPNNREPFCFSDIFYEDYNLIGEKLGKSSADYLSSSKNSSIFTFGAPKSGKTSTLFGDSSAPQNLKSSILFNLVLSLLEYTKRVVKEKTCSITLNFIEIQGEKVRDLGLAYNKKDEVRFNSLCDQISIQDLEIKEAAGKTYIQDVSILQVSSVFELQNIASVCMKARDTLMSDGHIVICVNFSQRVKMNVESARAYLIEFNGSLVGNESQDIQKILNKVYMKSLDIPMKNIPFRVNKITHLVQGALVSSSVSIVATVDTDNSKFKDSQDTLVYTKAIMSIDKKLKLSYPSHANNSYNPGEWVFRLQDEIAELELNIKKAEHLYEEKLRGFAKIIGFDEDLEVLVVGQKGSREYELCKKFRESLSTLNHLVQRNEDLEKKNEKYKQIMIELQVVQTSNLEKNRKYLSDLKSDILKIKSRIIELEEKKETNFTESLMSSTGNLEKQLYQSHFMLEEKSATLYSLTSKIESNTTDLKNILDLKELGKTELEHEYKRQILDNDYAYKQNLKSLEDDFYVKSKQLDRKISEESNEYRQKLREIENKILDFKEESVKLFEVARSQGKAIYDIEKGAFNQGINPVLIPRNHIPAIPSDSKFPLIFQTLSPVFLQKSRSSSLSKSQLTFPRPQQFFTIPKSLPNSTPKPKPKPEILLEFSIGPLLNTPIHSSSLSELRSLSTQLQNLIKSNSIKYSQTHESIQKSSEEIKNLSLNLMKINEEKDKYKELYQTQLRKRIDSVTSFTERPNVKTFLTECLSRPQTEKFADSQSKMLRNIYTTVSAHRLPFLSRNTPAAKIDFRPVTSNTGVVSKAFRSLK